MEQDRIAALEARIANLEAECRRQGEQLDELLRIVREHLVICPGHEPGDPMP